MKRTAVLLYFCVSFTFWCHAQETTRFDAAVYQAQKELNRLGYDAGQVDGLLGKKTSTAIRAFQESNGIPASGTIDIVTRQALNIRVGSLYDLAIMFKEGKEVAEDQKLAYQLLLQAATNGHVAAASNLGLAFLKGDGTKQDYERAAYWFRKAAEKGLASAQFNLGLLYDRGHGVTKDETEAVRWFGKAADQGLPIAQAVLGNHYATGRGVERDNLEAYKWLKVSLFSFGEGSLDDKARTSAKKAMSALEKQMTENEIEKALANAVTWTKQKARGYKASKAFTEPALPSFVKGFVAPAIFVVTAAKGFFTVGGIPLEPIWEDTWHSGNGYYKFGFVCGSVLWLIFIERGFSVTRRKSE